MQVLLSRGPTPSSLRGIVGGGGGRQLKRETNIRLYGLIVKPVNPIRRSVLAPLGNSTVVFIHRILIVSLYRLPFEKLRM